MDVDKEKEGSQSGSSTLVKLLAVFAVVLVIASVVAIALYVVNKNKASESSSSGSNANFTTKSSSKATPAQNREAVAGNAPPYFTEAAKLMNQSIGHDVKPCDNFYKFACDGFLKSRVLSDGIANHNFFTDIVVEITRAVKELLAEPDRDTDLPSIKKTKLYYRSCVNLDGINKRAVQTLKQYLADELGGWPIIQADWNEESFDFLGTLVKINHLTIMPIMMFYVGFDLKDNTKRRLSINQPSFGMPSRKFYMGRRDEGVFPAYETFITKVASDVGKEDNNLAAEDVKAIVDFEIQLAQISATEDEMRASVTAYNAMTFEDVKGNYSKIIDWDLYVRTLMSIRDAPIDDKEVIINQAPQYLQQLGDILINTPKRTLANYIIWTFVYNIIKKNAVGTIFTPNVLDFDKALYGASAELDWEASCVESSKTAFGLPIGRMFVQKYFDPEAKTIAEDMINEQKKAFSESLRENDWLDEKTKQYADEKKDMMVSLVGYPDAAYNDTYIDIFHGEQQIAETYFENVINILRFAYSDNLRQLKKPYNKMEWTHAAIETNAAYIPNRNQMMYPAGILQQPFYNKLFPKSMNYGGIGSIVGHEIIHGFDNTGRKFDKVGNLLNWWSPDAENKFKTKSQCIIDQYNNLIMEPSKIKGNGERTLGENIADNGGLRLAFRAYRNWVKSQGKEEPEMPGLNFNHNQIFFISFGQVWCTKETEASAKQHVDSQVHSLGEFRVNGATQNFKEFADAFSCPVGSFMNPVNKCHIW